MKTADIQVGIDYAIEEYHYGKGSAPLTTRNAYRGKVIRTGVKRSLETTYGYRFDGVEVLRLREDGSKHQKPLYPKGKERDSDQFYVRMRALQAQGKSPYEARDIARHEFSPVVDDFGNVVTEDDNNRTTIVMPKKVLGRWKDRERALETEKRYEEERQARRQREREEREAQAQAEVAAETQRRETVRTLVTPLVGDMVDEVATNDLTVEDVTEGLKAKVHFSDSIAEVTFRINNEDVVVIVAVLPWDMARRTDSNRLHVVAGEFGTTFGNGANKARAAKVATAHKWMTM